MGTHGSHITKNDEVLQVQQAIGGTNKHLGGVAQLLLAGQSFTPTSFIALLQSFLDVAQAVLAAKGQLRDQLLKERALWKQIHLLLKALRGFILAQYGSDAAAMLGDFGFTAPKAPAPKVAVKAQAQTKGKATREARHTMGKNQKKGVKGGPAPTPAPAGSSGGSTPRTQ